ncbi:MAG: lipoyl(octanoyl) transferase LipB [Bacteroidetes bacterium]|nr:lipoyl(octanoyl) transferase LipB [Bacteroidota bacterium]MBT4729131.1 lipoyl(octanoyl) transferase LipB [Bacteroidota bacterium]
MSLKVRCQDLGQIKYGDALAIQEGVFNDYLASKRHDNTNSIIELDGQFFLCEHKHVITLGKSGAIENLLLNNDELKHKGVEFFHASRGGDITYHGPGQIVGYPILDLNRFGLTVKEYVNLLEEMIIYTLRDYDIDAGRINGMTGVWLDYSNLKFARKICAIGVKVSRWISMHGFAFNIQTDLSYFNTIVPCGIKDNAVTSLSKELGYSVDLNEVKEKLKVHFSTLFNASLTTA